jgi:hypothetical protein
MTTDTRLRLTMMTSQFCALFHYILNSEAPVELESTNVRWLLGTSKSFADR